jgi:hypothetical protein
LLGQQPVHSGIEFILGRGVEMEEFGESAGKGVGMKGTRGSEFGGGFQDAGDDHGHDQIEFTAGMFVDEGIEMQSVQGAEDSGNVAVRAGADDVEGLRKRGTDGSSALEDSAHGIDLSRRPMGEVGEGTVADFAVEAEGLAEEDGGRGVAVRYGGDVHAYIISIITRNVNSNFNTYMTTNNETKLVTCVKTNEFRVLSLGT